MSTGLWVCLGFEFRSICVWFIFSTTFSLPGIRQQFFFAHFLGFFVVKQSFDIVRITFCFHQKFCIQNDSFEEINENVIAFEIWFIFNSLIQQKWHLHVGAHTRGASARARNHINYTLLFFSLFFAIQLMWFSLPLLWIFDGFICTFNYTPKHSKAKWEM